MYHDNWMLKIKNWKMHTSHVVKVVSRFHCSFSFYHGHLESYPWLFRGRCSFLYICINTGWWMFYSSYRLSLSTNSSIVTLCCSPDSIFFREIIPYCISFFPFCQHPRKQLPEKNCDYFYHPLKTDNTFSLL